MARKKTVRIPEAMQASMLEHARKDFPYEACGIISGDNAGEPVKFYPARNEYRSSTCYNVLPEDLLHIFEDLEEQGHYLWGIFHSHPYSEAYPSATDLEQAYYPEAYHLILSLLDYQNPVLRGFLLGEDGEVEEVEIEN